MELMILVILFFGVIVGLSALGNILFEFRSFDVDNYQLIKILRKEKNK